MQRTLKKFVLLLMLVCSIVCCAVFAACNNTPEQPSVGEQKVTYSVTVTTEDDSLSLTSLKAQWLKGTEAASEEIALNAEGKASVELESGNYTVTLKNVPATHTFTNASVTAANPNATIAITKKSQDNPNPPSQDETHMVILTVNVPEGVTLTADVKAQVYKGDTAVGAPLALAIANGKANIDVPTGSGYTVGLIGLPDYLECTEKVDVSGMTATINVKYAQIAYTVNVTADAGLSLDGVEAVLKAENEEVATAAVVDGKATLTALAGTYAVELKGLNAAYEYDAATVTIAVREATIAVTATKYTIHIDVNAANINIDVTSLSAKLVAGSYTSESVAFDADGKAEIPSPVGVYEVVIEGLDSTMTYVYAPVSIDVKETTVYVAEKPAGNSFRYQDASGDWLTEDPSASAFKLNKDGRFYLNSKTNGTRLYAPEVELKAYGADMRTYTVRWTATVDYNDYSNDGHTDSGEGFVEFVLKQNETVVFILQYNYTGVLVDGDVFPFIVTVECTEGPAEGSKNNPYYISTVVGTHSASEGVTDAFFVLPVSYSESYYTIAFEEGLNVSFYLQGPDASAADVVVNGGVIAPYVNGGLDTVKSWLRVVSTNGTPISFTLTTYTPPAQPGTEPSAAIVIEAGQEVGREEGSLNAATIWYSFTPATTGNYMIFPVITYDFNAVTVYKDYEPETGDMTQIGRITTSNWTTSFKLTAGETYLLKFEISRDQGGTATFYIDEAQIPAGMKDNPHNVTNTGDVLNTYEVDAISTVYFKHEITANSLDSNGNFVLKFSSAKLSNTRVSFYKTSTFSGTRIAFINYGDNAEVSIADLKEGDTVYFMIENGGSDATYSFYINPPKAAGLTVNTPLTVVLDATQYYFMSTVIQLDNVPAGKYQLIMESTETTQQPDPLHIVFGNVDLTTSSFKFTSKEFEIAEGVTQMTVKTNTWFPSRPVSVTFTLKPAGGSGPDVPAAGLTVNGTYELTIPQGPYFSNATLPLVNVPAGTYTLKVDKALNADMYLEPKGGSEITLAKGKTEIEIKIPANCESISLTVANGGVNGSLTLTFSLIGDEPADGLTVNGTYEADLSGNPATGRMTFEIPLVNVPAGEYELKVVLKTEIYNPIWVTIFGGTNEGQLGSFGTWSEATLLVKVGENAEEISLVCTTFNYGEINHAIFTLIGGGGEDPQPQLPELKVGEPLVVTMVPDENKNINQEILLVGVEAGEYTLKFENKNNEVMMPFLTEYTVKAGDYSVTTGKNNFDPDPVTVNLTIPAGCDKLVITASKTAATAIFSLTLNKVGGTVEPDDGTFTVTVVVSGYSVSRTEIKELSKLAAGEYTLELVDAGGMFSGWESITFQVVETPKTTKQFKGLDTWTFTVKEGESVVIVRGEGNDGTYTLKFKLTAPAAEYNVTFVYDDGETENKVVKTVDGKVANPGDPERDGYTFLGWFNGEEKWDFNNDVTEDITLTAKWEKKAEEGLTVGGTYQLTIAQGPYMSDATLPLSNVPEGTYILKLDKAITADAVFTPAGSSKQFTLNEGSTEIKIDIPANCKSIEVLIYYGGVSGSLTIEFGLEEYTSSGNEPQKPVQGEYTTVNIKFADLKGEHTSTSQKTMFHITSDSSFGITELVITFEEGLSVIYYNNGGYTMFQFGMADEIIVKSGDTLTFAPTMNADIYVYAPEGKECKIVLGSEGGSGPEEGSSAANPKAAVVGENNFEPFSEVWYVFNATQNGTFKFAFADMYNSTYAYFYSEADYENGALGNITSPNEKFEHAVKAGDVIYFHVESWGYGIDTVTFTITVEAAAETTEYNVTFVYDDGATENKVVKTVDGKVANPGDPAREGYTFLGWYNGEEKWDFNNDVTEDMTLTAKWQENKPVDPDEGKIVVDGPEMSVTFKAMTSNKGQFLPVGSNVELGKTYKLSVRLAAAQSVKRTLYVYSGLKTNEKYTFSFAAGSTDWITVEFTVTEYTMTNGLEYAHAASSGSYAAFIKLESISEPTEYDVTFDLGYDDAPEAPAAQKVAEGGKVVEPAQPVREGYTFLGWYDAKVDGNKWDFDKDVVNGNVTLYAYWEPISVEPVEPEDVKLNIGLLENIAELVAATSSANTTEATELYNDGNTVITANSNVKFTANSRTIEGIKFTHRLQTRATGTATKSSVIIKTAGAATITVYVRASGDSSRAFGFYDANYSVLKQEEAVANTDDHIYSYSVSAADTVIIGGGSGWDIYYIMVEYSKSAEPVPGESIDNPIVIEAIEGEHKAEGMAEAYFQLPANADAEEFVVNFNAENVEVWYKEGATSKIRVMALADEGFVKLNSGDKITPSSNSFIYVSVIKDGAELVFSIEKAPAPEAEGLGVGEENAYTAKLAPSGGDYATVIIPLVDVASGVYSLAITPEGTASGLDFTVIIGANQYKLGKLDEITIPEGCTEIQFKYYSGVSTEVTFTLTKVGGDVEPEDYELKPGGSVSVTFHNVYENNTFEQENVTVNLVDVEAGKYILSVESDGMIEFKVYYNGRQYNINYFNDYAQEINIVDGVYSFVITATSNSTYTTIISLKKVEDSGDNQKGDFVLDEPKAVTVEGTYMGQTHLIFVAPVTGTYKITISGEAVGKISVSIGEEVIEQGSNSGTFRARADIETAVSFICWANGNDVEFTATITLVEAEGAPDGALKVNGSLEVDVPQVYNYNETIIPLYGLKEGKEYTITITGLGAGSMRSSFTIIYDGNNLVLSANNGFSVTFTATAATEIKISSGEMGNGYTTVTLNLIGDEDEVPDGALAVGGSVEVDVPQVYNYNEKIVPLYGVEAGKEYTITITGLGAGAMRSNFTIEYDGKNMVLQASNGFSVKFTATAATEIKISSGEMGNGYTTVTLNLAAEETVEPQPTEYEVTFELGYDGATGAPAAQKVLENGKVEKPEDPTRKGYKFLGWFNGDNAWDFNAEVTENLTLTAKWEREVYTVYFRHGDTNGLIASSKTVDGKAQKRNDPTRTSYKFLGWFTQPEGGELFDFDTELFENTTIYAHWEEIVWTVTFVWNYENFENIVVKTVAGKVTAPEDLRNDHFWILEWLTVEGKKWIFSSTVTSDMTLTANWVYAYDLKLGEEAEIVMSGFYVQKTIYLEPGEYTVKLTGEFADHYRVADAFDKLGNAGEIIKQGALIGSFTITVADVYTLKFTDMQFCNHGCTVIITEKGGDEPDIPVVPQNVLELNKEKEIKLNGNWLVAEYIFNAPAAGEYTITLSDIIGDQGYTVSVNDKMLIEGDFGQTTATFQVEQAGEVIVKFVPGFGAVTFKVIITGEEPEVPTEYTVTFDYDDGVTENLVVETVDGKVAEPAEPAREGYIFLGWFDVAGEKWNFDADVTEDMTLTAHWEEIASAIQVADNFGASGSIKAGTTVADGDLFSVTVGAKDIHAVESNAEGPYAGKTVLAPDGKTEMDFGTWMASNSNGAGYGFSITAKADITITIYYTFANSSMNSSNAGGFPKYEEDNWVITGSIEMSTDPVKTAENGGYQELKLNLEEGMTINLDVTAKRYVVFAIYATDGVEEIIPPVQEGPSYDFSTAEPIEDAVIGGSEEDATKLILLGVKDGAYEITMDVVYVATRAMEDIEVATVYAVVNDKKYEFNHAWNEEETIVTYSVIINIEGVTEVYIYATKEITAKTISLAESDEVLDEYDPVLVLGKSVDVTLTASGARMYTFAIAQYGTYKIEISGDITAQDLIVNLDQPIIGYEDSKDKNENYEGGTLYNDGKLSYEFDAEAGEDYEIFIQAWKSINFTLTVSRLPDGDFNLGEAKEVALNSSSYTKQVYSFIAPVDGVYKITLSGNTNGVYVRNEDLNTPVVDFDNPEHSATFEASAKEVINLGFYQMYGTASVTTVIELIEVKKPVLVVNGEAINVKFGEIAVEGLKAGKDYTVAVLLPASLGKSADSARLVYGSNSYKLEFNLDVAGDNNLYATFTAEEGINTITISASALTATGKERVTVSIIEVKAAEGPAGPQVGETIVVTPGKGVSDAAEIVFSANFVAGGTYTLAITEGDGWYMYEFFLVLGSGETVKFDYPAGDTSHFEATFTADGSAVKIYAVHMRNADPSATTISIVAADVPSAGPVEPAGPAVGETIVVTPGKGVSDAAEIVFSANFVAGGTYTLAITEGDGWYMYEFFLVLSSGETVKFDYPAGDTSHFEATFTADGSAVKIYAVHMRNAAPSATTISIVAADVPSAGPVEPAGPAVGDSIKVTPGDGAAKAVELDFGAKFEAGKTYTLQISGIEGIAWNFKYEIEYGGASVVVFAYANGSDLVVTFTATEAPVKFFSSEHFGRFGTADLEEVTLTIVAIA